MCQEWRQLQQAALTCHISLAFRGWVLELISILSSTYLCYTKGFEGSKQMALLTGIIECCSYTATKQPSMPNLNSCSLPILPSNFLSPLSEISCFDVFFPAIPWPRSWLLCSEHRWLQAAIGRSPDQETLLAWEVALPWLAADARSKGHLSCALPWTRLCSLLCVASG